MIVKTNKEREILIDGGRKLAQILAGVAKLIKPGVRAIDLENFVLNKSKQISAPEENVLAFLGYQPQGALRPFPAGLCVSVNDEVVHGIPNEKEKIFKDGDIVTIDMGLTYQGLVTDSALTVPVGSIDSSAQKLIDVTKMALDLGIQKARAGNLVGEIGFAIDKYVRSEGFTPAEDLGGHGVGRFVHEEPYVPNVGPKDRGPRLQVGQVIAIEPIINEGGSKIYVQSDGYTIKTADGKRSAQFEHTVMVTDEEPIILTKE